MPIIAKFILIIILIRIQLLIMIKFVKRDFLFHFVVK